MAVLKYLDAGTWKTLPLANVVPSEPNHARYNVTQTLAAGWNTGGQTFAKVDGSGDAAAFSLTTNPGFVTVRDAGTYMLMLTASGPDNTPRFIAQIMVTNPPSGELVMFNEDTGVVSAGAGVSPGVSPGGAVVLAAGAKVRLQMWSTTAGALGASVLTITRQVQGQPGPPGPGGSNPVGAAGGELRGTYPNPTLAPREGAGRYVGTGSGWEGPFSGAIDFYDRNPAVTYFNLSFTPSMNCWWPVDGQILVKVLDAMWSVMNICLTLTPTDALNWAESAAVVYHNPGAGAHVTGNPRAVWALTAGINYQCKLRTSYQSGGSWQWYDGGSQHTFIQSPGAMPR